MTLPGRWRSTEKNVFCGKVALAKLTVEDREIVSTQARLGGLQDQWRGYVPIDQLS